MTRKIGVTSAVIVLFTVVLIYIAHAAGLNFNADGTISPFTVAGDLTTTGNVRAADGFGYVPLGTILPWYDVSGPAKLQPGWVESR